MNAPARVARGANRKPSPKPPSPIVIRPALALMPNREMMKAKISPSLLRLASALWVIRAVSKAYCPWATTAFSCSIRCWC